MLGDAGADDFKSLFHPKPFQFHGFVISSSILCLVLSSPGITAPGGMNISPRSWRVQIPPCCTLLGLWKRLTTPAGLPWGSPWRNSFSSSQAHPQNLTGAAAPGEARAQCCACRQSRRRTLSLTVLSSPANQDRLLLGYSAVSSASSISFSK